MALGLPPPLARRRWLSDVQPLQRKASTSVTPRCSDLSRRNDVPGQSRRPESSSTEAAVGNQRRQEQDRTKLRRYLADHHHEYAVFTVCHPGNNAGRFAWESRMEFTLRYTDLCPAETRLGRSNVSTPLEGRSNAARGSLDARPA